MDVRVRFPPSAHHTSPPVHHYFPSRAIFTLSPIEIWCSTPIFQYGIALLPANPLAETVQVILTADSSRRKSGSTITEKPYFSHEYRLHQDHPERG
jgi:hypothetical protein